MTNLILELRFWFLVSASILRQAHLGASRDHDLDDIPKFFGHDFGFRDEFAMCSERSEAAMYLSTYKKVLSSTKV